jgi:hypothetical protein
MSNKRGGAAHLTSSFMRPREETETHEML